MRATRRDQIINELKTRIKLLEKQKGGAEQQLREKLLLSVVSDSIEKSLEPEQLILNALERITIVMDAPLSACCEVRDKKLIPVEIYRSADEDLPENCGLAIPESISVQLSDGPVFLQKGSEHFGKIKFSQDFDPPPKFIAIFPFQTLYIPLGAFVFFEFQKKRDQFILFSLIIQHLIRFTAEKYEKLRLTQELKDLNVSFEENLKQKNEALRKRLEKKYSESAAKNQREAAPVPVNQPSVPPELQNIFLKNVGVEIRTPLNGILGFAELMRSTDLGTSETNTYIDIIKSCGKSLMKIVDDAQVYATIQSSSMQLHNKVFPLAPFMTELYDAYKNDELFRQRENLELKINININGTTEIEVDRDRLSLILTNLIGNAIKFTGSGYIEFGCSVENHVVKSKKSNLRDVVFFVKDTGIGIAEEYREFVYDEFYKVEHEISKLYGGLGLGLTIVRALVKMMGGKVWFDSVPGAGTEFFFSLPEAIKLSKAEMDALNGNGEERHFDWQDVNILIVEDDAMSVVYLKEALKATGARILLAGNGKTAIELVAAGTTIDVILMDIKLPGISGFEATKQIKSIAGIPIIAQTAYAMADDHKKIMQAGCDDYVSKPINRRKLLQKIHNLLAQSQVTDTD